MTRALGRYELLRPLARGGMAEVYLARRRAAGIEKWLVVKRMRPQHSKDPRFLDLFVREARLSMSLVHQNIVPVFDFGRIDDEVFLAMERVEGRDLGSSLARAPTHRLPPLLAAFVGAECCQALDYAHQRKGPDGVALGVVHRDVTPRNVLLSWSGEVKLTDFGIAALAGDATERLLGTPQYMAPEQARGEPIDPRADIYAIGLVLREVISGARPRPGDDRNAILGAARCGALLPWSHLSEPPGGPGDDEARAAAHEEPPPPALVAIIDRATAADADDRYPDARSMLEDLDTFIVGQRAAHKAEQPARQLAAWLATVWDGARDDVEADGAIHADHLVSFLDDGALDIIGTGTVRSMAATAAEDSLPGMPPESTPPPPPPLEPDEAAHLGDLARLLPITSSTSTVASGSFDTIEGAPGGDAASTTAPVPRTSPLRLSRIIGIAAVLITGAAAVVLGVSSVGTQRHSTPRSQRDSSIPPVASPPTTQPVTQPPAQPPASEAPASEALAAEALATKALAARSPTAEPPATEHPTPRPPTAERPATEPRGTRASGTPPHAARSPSTPTPAPAPPRRAADAGEEARDAATPPTSDGGAPPALCRVRINLTPWAYYRVDDDPTQHETPSTIELAPGPHKLHVWNPQLGIERDIVLHVPADRDTMSYSEPLRPPTLTDDAGAPR
jgi:hypothetical protein